MSKKELRNSSQKHVDLDHFEMPEISTSASSNYQASLIAAVPSEHETKHVEPEVESLPFWVSVSRKSGFRRLRRRGGCWYRAEVEEGTSTMTEAPYDAYCARCFKKPADLARDAERGEKSDESVDTDNESSSTASETASEDS